MAIIDTRPDQDEKLARIAPQYLRNTKARAQWAIDEFIAGFEQREGADADKSNRTASASSQGG